MHILSTSDIFFLPQLLIYLGSQGQRRIPYMFSFSSINIAYLLPQLHAFQWAVRPQSRSGAFRDTVLYRKCAGASAYSAEQGLSSTAFSSTPLQPVARALLRTLNPPVPGWGTLPRGARTTWLQLIPPHPSLQHPLTLFGKKGSMGGCGRAKAQLARLSEPALCRVMGRGKLFFESWSLGVTTIT